ncbi:hypothetical protein [Abyssisolibacter fermentans]|uniref:hypothetical protein n=1 Tax=Abyssisolibacter fermentans TaxID=1766203 RepID=UPI0012E3EC88|nr:hypothetical protein [Abyssisolibacter fermentans]
MNYSKKVTREKGHGRIEKREYFQTDDIDCFFVEKHFWKNLTSIGMVKRTVTTEKNNRREFLLYI